MLNMLHLYNLGMISYFSLNMNGPISGPPTVLPNFLLCTGGYEEVNDDNAHLSLNIATLAPFYSWVVGQ